VHFKEQDFPVGALSRRARLFELESLEGCIGWVPEDAQPSDSWIDLFDEFEVLSDHVGLDRRSASDIPPGRASEATNQPAFATATSRANVRPAGLSASVVPQRDNLAQRLARSGVRPAQARLYMLYQPITVCVPEASPGSVDAGADHKESVTIVQAVGELISDLIRGLVPLHNPSAAELKSPFPEPRDAPRKTSPSACVSPYHMTNQKSGHKQTS